MGRIYKIINKINNKIYIGKTTQTLEKRWYKHLFMASKRVNRYLYDAINHYGCESFNVELIEECDNKILNDREIYYIGLYNSNNPRIGYNMTLGGDGGALPPESIKSMIKKMTGRKLTQEHKNKISKSNKGKHSHPWTEEMKNKLSAKLKQLGHKPPITHRFGSLHPMWGKTHTAEAKMKISLSRLNKKYEDFLDLETATMLKRQKSLHWMGDKNPNYKDFDVIFFLDEILLSNNIHELCETQYNIKYPTLLEKFKKKFGCTITEYKKQIHEQTIIGRGC